MADSPTPNEQVSNAIEDSSSKAKENLAGRVSGLEEVIKRSTIEESEAQNYININKQLEEFLNKTRLSKADISDINALLGAQYAQSNDITKSMLGREPLNASNKRDLRAIIGLSQTILETNKNIVKMSKDTISNKSKEIASLKEQIKLESQSQKAKEKANAAREKSEEKFKSFKPSYKPTSELFKFAMDYSAHVAEHNALNPDNKKSTSIANAAMGVGAVTEVGSVALKNASQFATAGMSSGLGGALGGLSDMMSGALQNAGTLGGIAGTAFTGNPAIGAAIGAVGALAGSALDAMMKPAIQAYMINLETGIKNKVFNASVGRLGGFGDGLTGSSNVSFIRGDLSMEEVEKIKSSAAGAGVSFGNDNANAQDEFDKLAASTKVWGDASVSVFRTVAYATGDYKSALENINSIMASSREGAKNMNISIDDVAQQMANAGLQARLFGTDTASAMGVYRSLVGNKANIDNYMRSGIDLSKEGGSVVGSLAGVGKNIGLAQQYYFASQFDGESNPLTAGFKMKYGDQTDIEMQSNGLVKMVGKEGKDFYSASAVQDDFKSKLSDFLQSNGGDTRAAYTQLQLYAKSMGIDDKTTDMIMKTDLNDKKGMEGIEEAIRNPKTVLTTLQSMESINQNIKLSIASLVQKWDPAYDAVKWMAEKLADWGVEVEQSAEDKVDRANRLYDNTFSVNSLYDMENKNLEFMRYHSKDDNDMRKRMDADINRIRKPSAEQIKQNGMAPGGPLSAGAMYNSSRDQYLDSAGALHIVVDAKLLTSFVKRNSGIG